MTKRGCVKFRLMPFGVRVACHRFGWRQTSQASRFALYRCAIQGSGKPPHSELALKKEEKTIFSATDAVRRPRHSGVSAISAFGDFPFVICQTAQQKRNVLAQFTLRNVTGKARARLFFRRVARDKPVRRRINDELSIRRNVSRLQM